MGLKEKPMIARLPFGITAKRLINQLWGWFYFVERLRKNCFCVTG
ncbi:hypothetical protein MAMMFC1_00523 [Methylomusa anaerophila]|uniref:Uncharacterized protein n=1 Tax=Methylomusa anaerophila TaxID=1930071 RepID=A0A348AFN5_9FIRM|nr:hypothetical protein MAMMFC1_00523 [Methylomusa anaerophila]